ncbi:MAG: M6 family metalloprotease domain-containing protein [bacterium]|nr:M6 family metalloprotease domain-containing protein [bacterium]
MKVFRKSSYVLFGVSLVLLLMVFAQVNSIEEGKTINEPQYVQANPKPADIVLPDGTTLTVVLTGDEVLNYTRTTDGYTLLRGDGGFYYYAETSANGDMRMSSVKAKNPAGRSIRERRFLKEIGARLMYSEEQEFEIKDKWQKNKVPEGMSVTNFGPINDAFPTTGNRNMLVLLGEFSDWTFVKSSTDFDNIMNVGTTSFKAYYQDNSYGALNVTTTVAGPYQISMTMRQADRNYRGYVRELLDAAEADGINFADFDNNSDGDMDALYVIHAGYGEEYSGAPKYYVWSHSWSLSQYAVTYDGVYINDYATSPELRGLSGSTITAIGVIAHEFGHNLGAPDYYDTSGGSAWDLRYWDVMAGGSWNNNGDTPAQHNMYTKWQFGWANPTVIDSAAIGLSLRNTSDYNEAYRINTTTTNEFFILENRQLTGWDAALDHHGLFIFHIDGNFIDGLSSNSVNNDPNHQGVDLEEADNIKTSATYTGDPFPGSTNNTSFTDTTTPSAKSWANANTGKSVTNISEGSGIITFDFMQGAGPAAPAAPSGLSGSKGVGSVTLNWTDNSSDEDGFKIYRGTSSSNLVHVATVGADVTTYPDTGLARRTRYYFKVCAYNTNGEGCSSVISVRTR